MQRLHLNFKSSNVDSNVDKIMELWQHKTQDSVKY